MFTGTQYWVKVTYEGPGSIVRVLKVVEFGLEISCQITSWSIHSCEEKEAAIYKKVESDLLSIFINNMQVMVRGTEAPKIRLKISSFIEGKKLKP